MNIAWEYHLETQALIVQSKRNVAVRFSKKKRVDAVFEVPNMIDVALSIVRSRKYYAIWDIKKFPKFSNSLATARCLALQSTPHPDIAECHLVGGDFSVFYALKRCN